MNPNESNPVEGLLQQIPLRAPSARLDDAISELTLAEKRKSVQTTSGSSTLAWPAVFSIAVAAMICGLLLGQTFSLRPMRPATANAILPESDLRIAKANMITPASFNVSAFNLLHGHSQKPEYEDCGKCHQLSDDKDGVPAKAFEDWFYGDHDFFEKHHAHGFANCSTCHLQNDDREDAADETHKAPFNMKERPHAELVKLANCSDCHTVDAGGFKGFERNWHATLDTQANCSDCHSG